MVVYEVFLKVLYLIIVEHYLGELADTRVYTVHDLMGRYLLLEHGAALKYPFAGIGVQLNLLSVACHIDHVVDGKS